MMLRSILPASFLSIAIAFLVINPAKAEKSTVISRLIVREKTFLISQDSQGELEYSIVDSEGKSIANNISEAQLVAQYPDLHDLVRSAIADTEISPWAGLLDY